MKKIKQRKFKVIWKCKKCGLLNKLPNFPWHDDFVTCDGCGRHYQVGAD